MSATLPTLNWYLHRLRAMDAAELFGRAREKLRHQTERFAVAALRDIRPGDASGDAIVLPAKADAPAALREALAADAAKLLAGKWTLFGWKEVQVSSPPDWHCDSMRGVSVPSDGRKLDHRVLPGGADVRAIWEINRWAELVRLAMHGWLNDDAAAIRRAQEWLADWVEKNPLGQGVNWTSALEGGMRLINFCWFDALVSRMGDGGSEIGERQRRLADMIVPAHVWWLRRYLSFGSSANNHRLGELTGLLMAVKRWPELEKVTGSAGELWSQIADCVLAQFAEDGGNREQALHYHLFAFEMALHACRAMDVADGPVIERLQRAAKFFVRMSHPQEPWDYGDSDDAQIVPLTMNRGKAASEWDAWMKGDASAIGYWLRDFGFTRKPGSGACVVPAATAPALGKCRSLETSWWLAPQSGMAVIERDGWKVRVDASPLGFGKMAAHGHCDALHVSIWDGEHALVIDPGTGGYFGSKELRAELASWSAHNGPQPVGGFRTPRRIGTFLWAEQHARPVLTCDGNSLRASIQHEGMELSRIVSIEDGLVRVEDRISNNGSFRVCWTLAPECEVSGADRAADSMHIARDGKLWSFSLTAGVLQASMKSNHVSRDFGRTQKCRALEVIALHQTSIALRRV